MFLLPASSGVSYLLLLLLKVIISPANEAANLAVYKLPPLSVNATSMQWPFLA